MAPALSKILNTSLASYSGWNVATRGRCAHGGRVYRRRRRKCGNSRLPTMSEIDRTSTSNGQDLTPSPSQSPSDTSTQGPSIVVPASATHLCPEFKNWGSD